MVKVRPVTVCARRVGPVEWFVIFSPGSALSQLFFTLSIMLPVLPWKIESGIPGLSVLYLLQRVRTGQGFSCFVVENKREIDLSRV